MGFISNPFFLLIFLSLSFFLSSAFSFSVATPNSFIRHLQDEHFSVFDGKGLTATRWKSMMTMKMAAESTMQNSTNFILAAERTHRRDPTDNFRYYHGGWNLSNPHYFASTGYASLGPFVIAVLWFIIFPMWVFCMCIRCCCCPRKTYGYSRHAYNLSLGFLILLTIAVIAGGAFIFFGQARFEKSTANVINYVLHRVDTVVGNITDLFNNMLAAKDVGIGQISLPEKQKNDVDQIGSTINGVYQSFRDVTTESGNDVISFLNPLKLILIALATIVILIAFLGLLFAMLGVDCLIYSLVMVGWFIVTITILVSGIFLLVNNLVGDTCAAMNEMLQNPTANSALENIIPNIDNQVTKKILSATKDVTYGVVEVTNTYISNVSNANATSYAGASYYNQSGPLVPLLCNPYNEDDTDRRCEPNEVNFENAPEAWEKYICDVSLVGNCVTPGRLTPSGYKQITALVNVSHGLYQGMPFVIELMNGTFLTKTISDLSKMLCSSIEEYSEWVFAGLLASSIMLMFLLVLWIVYSEQRRCRVYTKKIDARALYSKKVFTI